jgi:leucyl/phenylalanyl-tRNA---protein transferase
MFDFSPENVLIGYQNGVFPMADSEDGEIYWYSPSPRAIIPIETYACSKSLRPVLNKNTFEIRINADFEGVIRGCSKPRTAEDGVWISNQIAETYIELHKMGFAHSIEAYYEGKLAGGLYGVALGSVFFGESMFYNVPNASKVAFHYLIERLKTRKYKLLDTQFINDNVARFGAIEISKTLFIKKLNKAIAIPNIFV